MSPLETGYRPTDYDGTTYYGRAQVKPAPFENPIVGTYIFMAGLSGAAQLIATLADLSGTRRAAGLVRRGRYLSLLGPVLGAPLLIYDLHTPQRFYNMLRIFRPTSPMSIGTWILMAFSGLSFATAALQLLADRIGRSFRHAARVLQIPAAVAGAGLATYTASLLSATSTPLWAAAPRALAVRFGASSVASAAAALALCERIGGARELRDELDALAVAALATELAATVAARRSYAEKGISAGTRSPQALAEMLSAEGGGIVAPVALSVCAGLLGRSGRFAGMLGSLAILGGSLALRIGVMSEGDESARRPQDSLSFAKPRNLPRLT